MQKQNIRFITLVTLILAAAFSRVIPHMPNFSPMDAVTLFAAAHFARFWQALLIPFAAMWLSSLFIDNVIYAAQRQTFMWIYPGFHWQYLGYFLVAVLGRAVFRNGVSLFKVTGTGLAAGAIFFLISNFGVWMQEGLYPRDGAGLIACYMAAVPFYRGTILGDAFYATVLFGGFYLLRKEFPSLRQSTENYS